MVLEHLGPMVAFRPEVRTGLPKEVPSKMSLQESGIRRVQEGAWGGDGAPGRRHSLCKCSETGRSSVCSHGMSGDNGRRGGRVV